MDFSLGSTFSLTDVSVYKSYKMKDSWVLSAEVHLGVRFWMVSA